MEKTMFQAVQDAEKVKPFAELNGKPVVTFEEYNDLVSRDHYMKAVPGIIPVDDRGLPTASLTNYVAMNPDVMFLNRYRVVKDRGKQVLQIVIDRRAIDEQPRGMVYRANLPAICLVREEDELKYDKTVLVSDKEFLSEFTHHLSNETMSEIAPLLVGAEDPTADSLPI